MNTYDIDDVQGDVDNVGDNVLAIKGPSVGDNTINN